MNKVSFYTLGCRLNQAEEESLRRKFLKSGFIVCEPVVADVVIINTCSVTAIADKKSRQTIRKLKNDNPKVKIVVIGCGAETTKDLPEVDIAILNENKKNTLDIVKYKFGQLRTKTKNPKQTQSVNIKNSFLEARPSSARTRALLKIQDGCNNCCAYCIIPYLRGKEISLSPEEVLKEAKELDNLGYKELVITGINVGKYNYSTNNENQIFQNQDNKNIKLVDLIRLILKETDFPRIRLSSINPQDVTDELLGLWAKEERLMRHLHLSLQSGSNPVLKRMRRPYTAQKYYSLVKNITQKIPKIAISTDIIVGFPGETDNDFKETIKFVNKVKFAKIHVFPFSKRPGTKASKMENQLESKTIKKRAQKLRKIGEDLREDFLKQFREAEADVLFEEKKGDFWYGLTSNYIRVKYKSNLDLRNKIKKIKLRKSNILS